MIARGYARARLITFSREVREIAAPSAAAPSSPIVFPGKENQSVVLIANIEMESSTDHSLVLMRHARDSSNFVNVVFLPSALASACTPSGPNALPSRMSC